MGKGAHNDLRFILRFKQILQLRFNILLFGDSFRSFFWITIRIFYFQLEVKIKEMQEREKNQQQASAKASGSETAKDETSTPQLPILDTEKGGQEEASALEKERTPSPPLKGEANESETVKELKTKLK